MRRSARPSETHRATGPASRRIRSCCRPRHRRSSAGHHQRHVGQAEDHAAQHMPAQLRCQVDRFKGKRRSKTITAGTSASRARWLEISQATGCQVAWVARPPRTSMTATTVAKAAWTVRTGPRTRLDPSPEGSIAFEKVLRGSLMRGFSRNPAQGTIFRPSSPPFVTNRLRIVPWRPAGRPDHGSRDAKEHGMTTNRRYDIDALRALAFLLLILYHVGMYYVAGWPWHIKSPHAADWLRWPMVIVNVWRMDLVFLISGVAFGFLSRGLAPLALIRQRALRLLLPLVFGMAVVGPTRPMLKASPTGWSRQASRPSWRAIWSADRGPRGLRPVGLSHDVEPPLVSALSLHLHRRSGAAVAADSIRADPASSCRLHGSSALEAAGAPCPTADAVHAGAGAALSCHARPHSRLVSARAVLHRVSLWLLDGHRRRHLARTGAAASMVAWVGRGLHCRFHRAEADRCRRPARPLGLPGAARGLPLDGHRGHPRLCPPPPECDPGPGWTGPTSRSTPGTCCIRRCSLPARSPWRHCDSVRCWNPPCWSRSP